MITTIKTLQDIRAIIRVLNIAGYTNFYVAGGAVRDVILDKPVRDVDVFIESDAAYAVDGDYDFIKKVLEIGDLCIDLIHVPKFSAHFNTFSCNLSQVYITHTEDLVTTYAFDMGRQRKELEFYNATAEYRSKIVSKYSDYTVRNP